MEIEVEFEKRRPQLEDQAVTGKAKKLIKQKIQNIKNVASKKKGGTEHSRTKKR